LEHIRFLAEVAPVFISILKTDSGSLVKVQMGVKGEEIDGAIREKLDNLAL
jgi:hypothetical protein